MDLKPLRLFIAVAETGSFVAAEAKTWTPAMASFSEAGRYQAGNSLKVANAASPLKDLTIQPLSAQRLDCPQGMAVWYFLI